ncbi:MAG: DUF6122 family protein [Sphingomonadales bacterium]
MYDVLRVVYREGNLIHIILHFLTPFIIAKVVFKKRWARAYSLMMVTMLVDLDHLLTTPIYDAGRCSIGFHPLHTITPVLIYLGLVFFPKTRLIGVGLIIHMTLDSFDCFINQGIWLV